MTLLNITISYDDGEFPDARTMSVYWREHFFTQQRQSGSGMRLTVRVKLRITNGLNELIDSLIDLREIKVSNL